MNNIENIDIINIRFAKAGSLSAVENVSNFNNINSNDTIIIRSVDVKSKNYDIIDKSTREIFNFVEGSRIQNSKVFAGHGTKISLHDGVEESLTKDFSGNISKC